MDATTKFAIRTWEYRSYSLRMRKNMHWNLLVRRKIINFLWLNGEWTFQLFPPVLLSRPQFVINFRVEFSRCWAPFHQIHLIHCTRTAIHFKCHSWHHGFRKRWVKFISFARFFFFVHFVVFVAATRLTCARSFFCHDAKLFLGCFCLFVVQVLGALWRTRYYTLGDATLHVDHH